MTSVFSYFNSITYSLAANPKDFILFCQNILIIFLKTIHFTINEEITHFLKTFHSQRLKQVTALP